MKIAITASENSADSLVDLRFGRAKHFVLFEPDTHTTRIIDNVVNLNAAQGAGIQSAKTITDSGADVLLTGHVGPKAFAALDACGVKIYSIQGGTVTEAIQLFQANSLQAIAAPDVEGHW